MNVTANKTDKDVAGPDSRKVGCKRLAPCASPARGGAAPGACTWESPLMHALGGTHNGGHAVVRGAG